MLNSYRLIIMLLCCFAIGGCAQTPITVEWEQAIEAYSQGQFEVACQQLEQLTSEISKDEEMWFKMGNACAKAQHPEKAVDAYQNAVMRNPQMEKAWYNMGVIQLQAALKTFIEMRQYSQEHSAVAREGERLQEGILNLLKGNDVAKDQE